MAQFTEDGTEVEDPDYPFFIMFVPKDQFATPDGTSRFFEAMDGDAIPAGTVMFDVVALDEPNNTATPWESPNLFKIGEIKLTTSFTQSLWGDERLFFSHSRLSDDFMGRREFRNRFTPTYDFDTWGQWPTDTPPEEVSEDELFAGMAGGCPFQWLIDQYGF